MNGMTDFKPVVFDRYTKLDTPMERAFGNYQPGRYSLVTANMRRLRDPIPFKSRQGKLLDWEAPTNVEEMVKRPRFDQQAANLQLEHTLFGSYEQEMGER